MARRGMARVLNKRSLKLETVLQVGLFVLTHLTDIAVTLFLMIFIAGLLIGAYFGCKALLKHAYDGLDTNEPEPPEIMIVVKKDEH